jgi:hypothetical protein
MGNEGARLNGMEQAPEKFSDTIRMFRPDSSSPILTGLAGMLKVVEDAKKDTTSGKMINWYVTQIYIPLGTWSSGTLGPD